MQEAETAQSILDEISAEVAQLSDEEIAKAAAAIQERNARARSRVTEESKAKMKEREKKRRLTNKEIMRLAKEKGLLAQAESNVAAAQA